jgi:hypothetical protein
MHEAIPVVCLYAFRQTSGPCGRGTDLIPETDRPFEIFPVK